MTQSWRRAVDGHIDAAVALVLFTRLSLLLAAPVTLWLIATRRPLAEQGLFFILWNLQALTQLMELGVGTLIVQFASHESPSLAWNTLGGLEGDRAARTHVYQAIRDGRRWYGRVAIALALAGSLGGLWLIGWRVDALGREALLPWMLTVACTAAYLPMVPLLCAIEGCGGLLHVQRMRLSQTVMSIVALWGTLISVNALWGVAAYALVWFVTPWIWLRIRYRGLLAGDPSTDQPSNAHEARSSATLAHVQWRTGATWLAWWLAPQCVTPIVLSTQGALPAGQVGMSFAIATAPLTLAIAWLQARYPQYAAMLARGDRKQLRRLATRATIQAASVCTAGVFAAALVVWVIAGVRPSLGARALPPRWIGVLGITNLAWLLVQSLSSYLRAWRQEPLMESAITGAAVVAVGTFAFASQLTTERVMAVYALLVAVGVIPLALFQFRRRYQQTFRPDSETREVIS